MNQPAYQDWSNYTVPSADNFLNGDTGSASSYTTVQVDCSSWDNVMVLIENTDGVVNMKVIISWFGYAGSIVSQPDDTLVIGPLQTACIVLPTRGRQIQMFLGAEGGTPTATTYFGVTGTSHEVTKYDAKSSIGSLVNDISAYGAGGLKTIPAAYWYEGPAQVAVWGDNGTAANAIFSYWDPTASAYETFAIVPVLGPGNSGTSLVYFPPSPVKVVVTNIGAAQNIHTHVVPAATR